MQDRTPIATLHVPVFMEHLGAIRSFVTAQTHLAGSTAEQTDRMVLAVVESVTNVIRHASGVPHNATITLHVSRDTQALWCSVSYPGDPYTPPPPDEADIGPENYAEGGYGNFIIHNACDSVTFEYQNGNNQTHLEIRFHNAP